jgi:hypothetical protein
VYGSQDAGRTVHCRDPIMNHKVREACSMKNLKGHNVIPRSGRGQLLWGPADLEGHCVRREGVEDKHYMLDFARLLPPEAPKQTPKGLATDGILIPVDVNVEQDYFTTLNCNEYLMTNIGVVPPPAIPVAIPVAAASEPSVPPSDGSTSETPASSLPAVATPVVAAVVAPAIPATPAVEAKAPEPQLDLRMFPRSEGVIAFNALATHLPINHRASSIADCEIRGPAVLFQDTGKIFFCLARSELVASSPEPLSSDAFSGFGACKKCTSVSPHDCCPHDALVNHEAAELNTNRLFHIVIPKFAADLDSRAISPSDSVALVRELHKVGINVRWLGTLRSHIKLEYISRFLLTEMITRTVRHMLTSDLRTSMKAAAMNMNAAAIAVKADAQTSASATIAAPPVTVPSEYTTVSELTGAVAALPSSSAAPNAAYTQYTTPTGYDLLPSGHTLSTSSGTSGASLLLADPMSPYKVATISLFNIVFGTSPAANSFWKNKLKSIIFNISSLLQVPMSR